MNDFHAFYKQLQVREKSEYVQMLAKLTAAPRDEVVHMADDMNAWFVWFLSDAPPPPPTGQLA